MLPKWTENLRFLVLESLLALFVCQLCCSGPPTLEDVTSKLCPPEKPYKCLPYGQCYGVESYCYSSSLESCFPQHVTDKKSWCREHGYNATFMNDKTCAMACSSTLLEDSFNLLHNACPDNSPHKCPPTGECYNSSQYCQSGKVQSCFPEDARTDLLSWCKTKGLQSEAFMNHNSCRLACQTLFSIADLAPDQRHDKNTVLLVLLIVALVVIFTGAVFLGKSKIQLFFPKKKHSVTFNQPRAEPEEKKCIKPSRSGELIQRQNSRSSDSSSLK
ncbi:uncharacterized protein LOC129922585 [Biomphalaria glabrata]|uniref:Uncharacterized protein LOC129922585 n=1 Tax=Biomphalaria glabrata TaxID=6526 RepID=A0A9W2YR79_BIOGL|nr:uncharacterized protein LOC129922585 [Biomphalaria glabrata]